jgi:hypothetical protein
MFDPFLLLTPILVLLVFGLVRFIGCDVFFSLDHVDSPPPVVEDLTFVYGDETVTLSWAASEGATRYQIKFRDSATSSFTDGPSVTETSVSVMLAYGVTRHYVVHAVRGNASAQASNEVTAIGSRAFIAFVQPFGTVRNFFSGWLGIRVAVGAAPITLVAMGRVRHLINPPPAAPTPLAQGHGMKLVLPGPTLADPATDVAGANVVVAPQQGVEAGDFVYETLTTPQVLNANTTYYVVCHELARSADPTADEWHDFDTTVFTQPEAAVTEAVFAPDATSAIYSVSTGGPGHAYVPVNFLYHP